MTVEELEIIVKANIKQVMPQLKEVVKQVKDTVKSTSGIDNMINKSQEIGRVTAKATNQAKSNINKYENSLKQTTKQAEYIKNRIEELNYQLEQADKGYEVGDTQKIEAQIEKLTNQYNNLTMAQKNSNKESKKVNQSIAGLNKVISTVKKYALALFSIRGIYSLISRASSAYFSFDAEQAKKAESIWVGLGAIVQPIVQGIMNVMAKGVAYINAFIKALFGIDLIARANTKALKAQANATKEATGVADFDEIHNIQETPNTETTSGSSGISQIELPDVDTSKVEYFALKVREIINWIKENKNLLITFGIIIGTVFGAKILGDFLSKLGEIKISMENIDKVVKGMGWIAIIAGLVGYISSIKEMIESTTFEEFINGLSKALISLGVLMAGVLLIFGAIPALIVGVIGLFALLVVTFVKYGEEIKNGIDNFTNWLFGIIDKDWTEMFGPILGEIINGAVATFKGLFTGITSIFKGIIDFIAGVFTGDWRRAWDGVKNIFSGIIKTLTAPFKSVINGIISGLNILINGINRMKIKIPNWSPINPGAELSFNIPKINYFKNGAVLYEETAGVMAEYPGARTNPEIVTPEKLLYKVTRQAYEDSEGKAQIIDLTAEANLIVNGRTLAKQTLKDFNDEAISKGYKPILQKG